jgi:hypothetical protein
MVNLATYSPVARATVPLPTPWFYPACQLVSTAVVLVGALLIGSVVPFTLIIIKPTNAQLLTQGRDLASAETRALLEKWGRLHAVRSVSSLAASLIFLAAGLIGHG